MNKIRTSTTYSPTLSFLYYLIFLLIGLFLKIRLGLYVADIIVLIFIVCYFVSGRKISKGVFQYLLVLWASIVVPALISFAYQCFIDVEVSSMSFYIIYNSFILCCYILFFATTFQRIELNYNIIILFVSIPVFLSLAMYFSSDVFLFFQSLYSLTYRSDRFGGIFGRDVNQLGYYSTLVIILSCFLRAKKQIGIVFYIIILSALFAVLTSGMRAGVLLVTGLFILFSLTTKFKMIRIKDLVVLSLIIVVGLVLFADVFQGEIEYFKERYSLELLYDQATGANEDKHMGAMYKKYFAEMLENEDNFSFLFSLLPNWKFPDSFIIFTLANGGIIGFFGFITFALFNVLLILRNKVPNKPILFFILLFNVLISIKGSFMFNNIGMFLFAFMVTTILNDSKQDSGVVKPEISHSISL